MSKVRFLWFIVAVGVFIYHVSNIADDNARGAFIILCAMLAFLSDERKK